MSEIGDYEVRVAAVEKIIGEIESGKLPLEEVFRKFAIAIEELGRCETILDEGRNKMNLLIESLEVDDAPF